MENQMSAESKGIKVEQQITVNIGGSTFNLNRLEACQLREALSAVLHAPVSRSTLRSPAPKLFQYDRGREFEIWCEAGRGA